VAGTRRQSSCLVIIFLMLIALVAPIQVVLEWRAGEPPRIVELFRQAPTSANLRRLESDLEGSCHPAQAVRPWMQWVRFVLFGDAGDKVVLGRAGWFFYRPAVRYLIEPYSPDADESNIFDAILSFRDDLAHRGIMLVVMPAPNKASVYPELLAGRAAVTTGPVNATTRGVLAKLKQAGVEVIDLFELYAEARKSDDGPVHYLAQDSHWSPEGMRLAADAVAERIVDAGYVDRGTTRYGLKPVNVDRYGDVLRMIRVPQVERLLEPQTMHCSQVIDTETGGPYKDDPNSPILVLGDSFLRIFEHDEPGSGGFVAHLARNLGFPLSSVVNDGGASTLVRQQVASRPALLEGKKLVIWEFVERDIRFGTEGWQVIPLP